MRYDNTLSTPLRQAIWLNEQAIARAAHENRVPTVTLTPEQIERMPPRAVRSYSGQTGNVFGAQAAGLVRKSQVPRGQLAGGVALAAGLAAPVGPVFHAAARHCAGSAQVTVLRYQALSRQAQALSAERLLGDRAGREAQLNERQALLRRLGGLPLLEAYLGA